MAAVPIPSHPCTVARALPCIREELCRKTWIVLCFVTHVSFLRGREVRRGKYPPKPPHSNPRGSQLKLGCSTGAHPRGIAALQPPICGVISGQGMVPVGENAPGVGKPGEGLNSSSYTLKISVTLISSSWLPGERVKTACFNTFISSW